MSTITPTDTQFAAIKQIKEWFEGHTDQKQVFRLFGYAGTGKSTVLKFALDELGLQAHRRDEDGCGGISGVVTATFTGKAALVLRRKGTPARTIHSLIYSVMEATEAEIEKAKAEIEDAEKAAAEIINSFDRVAADALIEAKRQALREMKKPHFALNSQSDAAECKLIVLDEVSMVGEEMAKDLLSFGKPILVLGDPGQLPPIKGEGAFTNVEPDIMLTDIHRQAAESAIIRLATMARMGEPIAFGNYDGAVAKLPKCSMTPAQMLRAGQVICGMNATRRNLNNGMRVASGINGTLPNGPSEKIICLKNKNDLGLINGMFIELSDCVDDGEHYFTAIVHDDEGNLIGKQLADGRVSRQAIYKGDFLDHFDYDRDRSDRDWKIKKSLVEATFGWAITCHKAQGSQWENIVVWDDGLGKTDLDRRRWFYTAITRAEKGLVLLG